MERAILSEHIPLDTPYIIQIFPVYACNLKCEYCIYSLPESKRGFISKCKYMDFDLYKKVIDNICHFNNRIKMLRFAAMGEPLIHPKIVQMIEYAKRKRVAESIEIVTNGTLLTHNLSLDLINAGLDKLRVSIEGLSSQEYLKHCGKEINYLNLCNELEFFFLNRKDTKVYIKIIDYMLNSDSDKQKFYQTFSTMCDEIAIEYLTPTIKEIDYNTISNDKKFDISQNGIHLIDAKICPMPFYFMQVNPDGIIVPCCNTKYPIFLGDATDQNIIDIWSSIDFNNFRYKMLSGAKNVNQICHECNLYQYGMRQEDYLDKNANILKERMHSIIEGEK